MDVMKSERNKTIFISNGYKFRFHKMLKNEVQRWTCSLSTCKCYMKINDSNTVIDSFEDHKHNKPDEKTLNRQKLSNSLKRKAVEDISSKPFKLLHSELQRENVNTLTLSDTTLIKRNIRNIRSTIHHNLPKTVIETHEVINKIIIKTNTDEPFLMVNDHDNNIIGFSTTSNLMVLCDTNTIYVDGTFKSCPKYFLQIFTIHALVNEMYVPLVFFLLPNKETKSYFYSFKYTMDQCTIVGLTFSPKYIFIDFEKSIHNAAQQVWPAINIKGCRFHLGQSWWKKIQCLGLSTNYKKRNSEESNFLKIFFGLPFLRPNDVYDCFIEDIMPKLPANENIKLFTDYILKTYIASDSTFPPNLWAEFSTISNRTTNSCESFHAKLNSLFYTSHPNIYIFIDALKEIQSNTYIQIRSKELCKKSKHNIEKENILREQMTKYKNNEISRLQFIKLVSLKYLPV